MQKLVREYLNEWNRKQKKRRKAGIAAALLVVLVVGAVFGTLTQYGIAMTGNAECGLEEHTHTDDCYTDALVCGMAVGEGAHTHNEDCYMTERALVCVLEESEEHIHTDDCYEERETQICGLEESDGHTHTDACYEKQLTCEKEEHIHTDSCYTAEDAPDATADVESQDIWDAEYENVNLPDAWGERLAAVAQMQIGNKESDDNYTVAEDGSQNGYTRYGQFVNDVYRDHWDTAFVNFCMYYAGLTETELFPDEKDGAGQYQEELTDAKIWQEEFKKINKENDGTLACLTEAAGYEPKAGDLVFFEKDTGDGSGAKESRMGIVSSYNKETDELKVTEGDSNDAVEENTYGTDDDQITGYLQTTSLEEDWNNAGSQYSLRSEAPVETDDGTINETDGEQGAGDAYVSDFNIVKRADGSAPFDEDNSAGNDKSDANGIVRTFDTVRYSLTINMAGRDEKEFKEACIKLKFVLPVSEEKAAFDLSEMKWIENGVVTTEKDAEGAECQVLTGEKHLSSTEKNVVPGTFTTEDVVIKIKNMKNGDTLNPTFYARMEGNSESEWKEINTATNNYGVTVSAAPKYNVSLKAEYSYRDQFDFSTGSESAANKKINGKDTGKVCGEAVKVGVVLQLYNDSDTKGMKGIELPEQGKDITFELEVGSEYEVSYWINDNGTSVQKTAREGVTNEYTPLLWSYDGSKNFGYGGKDQHGRELKDNEWSTGLVPDNKGGGQRACYDGGTWNAEQQGKTIKVKVSGWKINPDQMPELNGAGERNQYGANVGCFSAGEFVIVQPFNRSESYNAPGPQYNIVEEFHKKYPLSDGTGMFYTSIKVKDLTVGGNETTSQSSEEKEAIPNFKLTLPGNMTNRVGYLRCDQMWASPGYDDGHYGHGDSYVLAGEDIDLACGFTYQMIGYDERMCWGSNLMKFEGEKLDLTGTRVRDCFTNDAELNATFNKNVGGKGVELGENTFVFYATKEDGSPWKDLKEMEETYEEKLVFYKSLDDIPKGHTCIGILTVFKGLGTDKVNRNAIYQVAHSAKAKKEYIGETCVLVSTARVWTERTFREETETEKNDPSEIQINAGKKIVGWPVALPKKHYRSGNTLGVDYKEDPYDHEWGSYGEYVGQFYIPETYKEDGSGVCGTHNSGYMQYGDTLLILGYETKITKSLMQEVAQTDETTKVKKEVFSLNDEQRVADYKLQPSTIRKGDAPVEQKADLTIVDTLPAYMTYIEGSAYWGGDYTQTSPQGGTQGHIIGGTEIEPIVTPAADGKTTLTWTIPEATIGTLIEPIYYSVKIGDEESPENDIRETTSLKNEVYITAPGDRRIPTLENGNYAEKEITAQREKQTSFGKTVSQMVVEDDGTIDYTIYFNNFNDTPEYALVVDTMPMDETNGSEIRGTYKLRECKLDDISKNNENIKIYYTTQYDGTPPVTKEEIEKGWTPATITDGVMDLTGITQLPTAWAVLGPVQSGYRIHVNLKIKLEPGESSELDGSRNDSTDKFINAVTSGNRANGEVKVSTETVRRVLEGLTWMDYNRNGLQDEGEDLLSGVTVKLLKLEANGTYAPVCYPNTHTEIQIQTGQQVSVRAEDSDSIKWYGTDIKVTAPGSSVEAENKGRYRFLDLPPGTYAVQFLDGNGDKISQLKPTKVNAGDDTMDSDGEPSYDNNGNFVSTTIQKIAMPTPEEIKSSSGSLVYRSEHNDSGFYPVSELRIVKKGKGSGAPIPLSGAEFTLSKYTVDENGVGTEGEALYKGCSVSDDGTVQWTKTGETTPSESIAEGVYLMKEVKAPEHYLLSTEEWIITVDADGFSTVTTKNGDPVDFVPSDIQDGKVIYTYTFYDILHYELPSAGGIGIYWYTIGGMLLMFAAALILYKNKCKEVLGG